MSRTRKKIFFPLWVFLGLLWGQLFLSLYPSWADGSYYDYGLLVPPLLVLLFVFRFQQQTHRSNPPLIGKSLQFHWIAIPLLFLFLLALRLVASADTSWRAPLYFHATIVAIISYTLLARWLGKERAIPFLPILLLPFFAIPLPSFLEAGLIHGLTSLVIETATFANRWMGFPVITAGETLFVNQIPLFVSEGCSGIRSFQLSIFAGFVVGELFRCRILFRVILLGIGVAAAFLFNAARVVYLVRHAALKGDESLQQLHDSSGHVTLALTLSIILFAGFLIAKLSLNRKALQPAY